MLTEVADAFSESNKRGSIKPFVEHLQTNPTVEIVPASPELFARGLELYAQRLDKGWSLTDCISFTVMEARGLSEAATGDQHFVQAGFKALLT